MVINMKKKVIIISVLAVAIIAISLLVYASIKLNGQAKEEDSHLIEISFSELQEKIDNKETFIFVITQKQCSHCAEYKPVLKKVLAEYDIYAYELSLDNLDAEKKGKLNDIANVSGTPATIFIEDGVEKNTSSRLSGTKTESKIVSRLKAMGYIEE